MGEDVQAARPQVGNGVPPSRLRPLRVQGPGIFSLVLAGSSLGAVSYPCLVVSPHLQRTWASPS